MNLSLHKQRCFKHKRDMQSADPYSNPFNSRFKQHYLVLLIYANEDYL